MCWQFPSHLYQSNGHPHKAPPPGGNTNTINNASYHIMTYGTPAGPTPAPAPQPQPSAIPLMGRISPTKPYRYAPMSSLTSPSHAQEPPRFRNGPAKPRKLIPSEKIEVPKFLSVTRSSARYYYETYLGCGGYGSVWTVIRSFDSKPFAIKIMEATDENGGHEAATKEVSCLELVRHFACVALVETHYHAPYLFIVTEYCDGGSMHYQLHNSNAVIRRNIGFLAFQLIAALQYLHHQRKLLHRDIKPENVFLYTNGLLKIGDFGLSNVYETLTDDAGGKTICGTAEYFAPELCEGKTYGHAADMWSLGVLLYECITGVRPFKADSAEALYKSIINDPVKPIESYFPQSPNHSSTATTAGAPVCAAPPPYYIGGGGHSNSPIAGNSLYRSTSSLGGGGASGTTSPGVPQFMDERMLQMIYRLLEKDPKARPTSTELLLSPFMQEMRIRLPELLRKSGKDVEGVISRVEEDLDHQFLHVCQSHTTYATSVSRLPSVALSASSWSTTLFGGGGAGNASPSRRASFDPHNSNHLSPNEAEEAAFFAGGAGMMLRESSNTPPTQKSMNGVSLLRHPARRRSPAADISFEGAVQRISPHAAAPPMPSSLNPTNSSSLYLLHGGVCPNTTGPVGNAALPWGNTAAPAVTATTVEKANSDEEGLLANTNNFLTLTPCSSTTTNLTGAGGPGGVRHPTSPGSTSPINPSVFMPDCFLRLRGDFLILERRTSNETNAGPDGWGVYGLGSLSTTTTTKNDRVENSTSLAAVTATTTTTVVGGTEPCSSSPELFVESPSQPKGRPHHTDPPGSSVCCTRSSLSGHQRRHGHREKSSPSRFKTEGRSVAPPVGGSTFLTTTLVAKNNTQVAPPPPLAVPDPDEDEDDILTLRSTTTSVTSHPDDCLSASALLAETEADNECFSYCCCNAGALHSLSSSVITTPTVEALTFSSRPTILPQPYVFPAEDEGGAAVGEDESHITAAIHTSPDLRLPPPGPFKEAGSNSSSSSSSSSSRNHHHHTNNTSTTNAEKCDGITGWSVAPFKMVHQSSPPAVPPPGSPPPSPLSEIHHPIAALRETHEGIPPIHSTSSSPPSSAEAVVVVTSSRGNGCAEHQTGSPYRRISPQEDNSPHERKAIERNLESSNPSQATSDQKEIFLDEAAAATLAVAMHLAPPPPPLSHSPLSSPHYRSPSHTGTEEEGERSILSTNSFVQQLFKAEKRQDTHTPMGRALLLSSPWTTDRSLDLEPMGPLSVTSLPNAANARGNSNAIQKARSSSSFVHGASATLVGGSTTSMATFTHSTVNLPSHPSGGPAMRLPVPAPPPLKVVILSSLAAASPIPSLLPPPQNSSSTQIMSILPPSEVPCTPEDSTSPRVGAVQDSRVSDHFMLCDEGEEVLERIKVMSPIPLVRQEEDEDGRLTLKGNDISTAGDTAGIPSLASRSPQHGDRDAAPSVVLANAPADETAAVDPLRDGETSGRDIQVSPAGVLLLQSNFLPLSSPQPEDRSMQLLTTTSRSGRPTPLEEGTGTGGQGSRSISFLSYGGGLPATPIQPLRPSLPHPQQVPEAVQPPSISVTAHSSIGGNSDSSSRLHTHLSVSRPSWTPHTNHPPPANAGSHPNEACFLCTAGSSNSNCCGHHHSASTTPEISLHTLISGPGHSNALTPSTCDLSSMAATSHPTIHVLDTTTSSRGHPSSSPMVITSSAAAATNSTSSQLSHTAGVSVLPPLSPRWTVGMEAASLNSRGSRSSTEKFARQGSRDHTGAVLPEGSSAVLHDAQNSNSVTGWNHHHNRSKRMSGGALYPISRTPSSSYQYPVASYSSLSPGNRSLPQHQQPSPHPTSRLPFSLPADEGSSTFHSPNTPTSPLFASLGVLPSSLWQGTLPPGSRGSPNPPATTRTLRSDKTPYLSLFPRAGGSVGGHVARETRSYGGLSAPQQQPLSDGPLTTQSQRTLRLSAQDAFHGAVSVGTERLNSFCRSGLFSPCGEAPLSAIGGPPAFLLSPSTPRMNSPRKISFPAVGSTPTRGDTSSNPPTQPGTPSTPTTSDETQHLLPHDPRPQLRDYPSIPVSQGLVSLVSDPHAGSSEGRVGRSSTVISPPRSRGHHLSTGVTGTATAAQEQGLAGVRERYAQHRAEEEEEVLLLEDRRRLAPRPPAEQRLPPPNFSAGVDSYLSVTPPSSTIPQPGAPPPPAASIRSFSTTSSTLSSGAVAGPTAHGVSRRGVLPIPSARTDFGALPVAVSTPLSTSSCSMSTSLGALSLPAAGTAFGATMGPNNPPLSPSERVFKPLSSPPLMVTSPKGALRPPGLITTHLERRRTSPRRYLPPHHQEHEAAPQEHDDEAKQESSGGAAMAHSLELARPPPFTLTERMRRSSQPARHQTPSTTSGLHQGSGSSLSGIVASPLPKSAPPPPLALRSTTTAKVSPNSTPSPTTPTEPQPPTTSRRLRTTMQPTNADERTTRRSPSTSVTLEEARSRPALRAGAAATGPEKTNIGTPFTPAQKAAPREDSSRYCAHCGKVVKKSTKRSKHPDLKKPHQETNHKLPSGAGDGVPSSPAATLEKKLCSTATTITPSIGKAGLIHLLETSTQGNASLSAPLRTHSPAVIQHHISSPTSTTHRSAEENERRHHHHATTTITVPQAEEEVGEPHGKADGRPGTKAAQPSRTSPTHDAGHKEGKEARGTTSHSLTPSPDGGPKHPSRHSSSAFHSPLHVNKSCVQLSDIRLLWYTDTVFALEMEGVAQEFYTPEASKWAAMFQDALSPSRCCAGGAYPPLPSPQSTAPAVSRTSTGSSQQCGAMGPSPSAMMNHPGHTRTATDTSLNSLNNGGGTFYLPGSSLMNSMNGLGMCCGSTPPHHSPPPPSFLIGASTPSVLLQEQQHSHMNSNSPTTPVLVHPPVGTPQLQLQPPQTQQSNSPVGVVGGGGLHSPPQQPSSQHTSPNRMTHHTVVHMATNHNTTTPVGLYYPTLMLSSPIGAPKQATTQTNSPGGHRTSISPPLFVSTTPSGGIVSSPPTVAMLNHLNANHLHQNHHSNSNTRNGATSPQQQPQGGAGMVIGPAGGVAVATPAVLNSVQRWQQQQQYQYQQHLAHKPKYHNSNNNAVPTTTTMMGECNYAPPTGNANTNNIHNTVVGGSSQTAMHYPVHPSSPTSSSPLSSPKLCAQSGHLATPMSVSPVLLTLSPPHQQQSKKRTHQKNRNTNKNRITHHTSNSPRNYPTGGPPPQPRPPGFGIGNPPPGHYSNSGLSAAVGGDGGVITTTTYHPPGSPRNSLSYGGPTNPITGHLPLSSLKAASPTPPQQQQQQGPRASLLPVSHANLSHHHHHSSCGASSPPTVMTSLTATTTPPAYAALSYCPSYATPVMTVHTGHGGGGTAPTHTTLKPPSLPHRRCT